MPDAFISYSRKDKAFVLRLRKSFQDLGRDIWVDWEDIPQTANWREEIYEGVANSDNFVFIVSPDSATSVECRNEIEAAVASNKRVIPIAVADVRGDAYQALHPAISSHNWIFCREGVEDYETVFQSLIRAMDTDLDHVRQHTRLLVRAQEWDQKKRDNSYLLSGTDLHQAEAWLAVSQNKMPAPTELHAQYIFASRQAAAARQRVLMVAALVASVLMAVLAVVAVLQWFDARRNSNIARSRELAANAQNAITNGNYGLAIALGTAANRISDAPADVMQILAQAAYEPGTRRVFAGQGGDIWYVVVNSQGDKVLSSGKRGSPFLWDLETGSVIRQFEGYDGPLSLVLFSPDGVSALTDSEDGTLLSWNVDTGKIDKRFQVSAGRVLAAAYDPSGATIVAGYSDGSVVSWNVQAGTEQRQITTYPNSVDTIAFSYDLKQMISVDSDIPSESSNIVIWDLESGEPVNEIQEDAIVYTVEFSPDGKSLLLGLDFTMRLISIEKGQETARFERHDGRIWSMAFSADGRQVVSASEDNFMNLWDAATGVLLHRFVGHTGAVRVAAFVPGTERVITGSKDGTLRLWDLNHPLQQQSFSGLRSYVLGLAFNKDETISIAGAYNNPVQWWNASTGERVSEFTSHNAGISKLGFDSQNEFVVSLDGDGSQALVWDSTTGSPLYRLAGHEGFIYALGVSPQGGRAATGDGSNDGKGSVFVWDWNGSPEVASETAVDLSPTRKLSFDEFPVNDLSLSPDGRLAVIASFSGQVRLVDLETEQILWTDQAGTRAINSVDFSPKGDMVLSAGDDAVIRIWDAQTGKYIRELWGHGSGILKAEFSADGSKILSAGYLDKTVRLWDVSAGRELNRLQVGSAAMSATLNRAGTQALIGLDNGGVFLFDVPALDVNSLVDWAEHNRAVPKFSCIEYFQYHIEPVDSECNQEGT